MRYRSISDEADVARCESCEDDFHRDDGVDAECCGGWYCKKCWRLHRCDQLVDYDGLIVRVGDTMMYVNDIAGRQFVVTEIVPTFTKGQTCVGEKKLKTKTDGKRNVLRVRMMTHV